MDGLIEKITIYDDYECESPLKVFEKYANRGDRLYKSTKDLKNNGSVVDEYKRGRIDACKGKLKIKAHNIFILIQGLY